MTNYDEIVKVRIHAGSPDVWQDVHAYITYVYNCVDIEIKMPLYLKPDDIITDVREALRKNHIYNSIEDLHFTLSPEIL